MVPPRVRGQTWTVGWSPMPWRLLMITCLLGGLGGAVLGFVRGLDYLPTLPLAVVEGAVLVGMPSALLGLVLTGLWALGSHHRSKRTPDRPHVAS